MDKFLSGAVAYYRQTTSSLLRVETALRLDRQRPKNTIQLSYVPDHVAFRSFRCFGGIDAFAKHPMLQREYDERDTFAFPSKKLSARWFSPKEERKGVLPRLFISEIHDDQLSLSAQDIIRRHASPLARTAILDLYHPFNAVVKADETRLVGQDCHYSAYVRASRSSFPGTEGSFPQFWCGDRLPPTMSFQEWELLQSESDYAAWVALHGTTVNHVALSSRDTNFQSLDVLIQYLENATRPFTFCEAGGGKIKRSRDGLLLQTSLVADNYAVPLRNERSETAKEESEDEDAHVRIAGAAAGYVEFVERLDGREGFEEGNATHIFESTKVSAKD